MMKKAPPSLLVLRLAILAAVLITILVMHVEPAQAGFTFLMHLHARAGSRQPTSTPPSPIPHTHISHCCK
ncbi:hypothetical protein PAHAL_3G049900 [Panicum hallii]|uniref:Secreted protein n=1 Tax=Panicum hallii TaxID=206008 RepID=A0A2T8KH58_9POAL|nr:hypothetical protein PAHAL_3G049900 [Panicum hallii]